MKRLPYKMKRRKNVGECLLSHALTYEDQFPRNPPPHLPTTNQHQGKCLCVLSFGITLSLTMPLFFFSSTCMYQLLFFALFVLVWTWPIDPSRPKVHTKKKNKRKMRRLSSEPGFYFFVLSAMVRCTQCTWSDRIRVQQTDPRFLFFYQKRARELWAQSFIASILRSQ